MPRFDYRIAVGHNNAAGFVNVEAIVPSGNIACPPPVARGNKNPGIRRIRANGLTMTSGYTSQIWRMIWLTYEQYAHWKTTYCGGGYSGLVTVRTRMVSASYANWNAVLIMPFESDLAQNDMGWGYRNVDLTLMRMMVLS